MLHGSSPAIFALTAALMLTMGAAQAPDDARYPTGKVSGTTSIRGSAARR